MKKQRGSKVPVISLVGSRQKVPKNLTIPPKSKVPSNLGLPNLEDGYLSWRFSKADLGGPYKCANLSYSDFQQLWERLKAFETKNLSDLRKTGSHPIPVLDYCKEARERLLEIRLDDIEELWSFRIDGACRLHCFQEETIFAVLWWDPDHGACPVEKSHTH